MKACVLSDVQKLEIRDIPLPPIENGGMLVKVMACGICGSDIRNYHNGLRSGVREQVMGHEITGIVEEAGSEVTTFKKGDRVAISPDVSCGQCYYCERGLVNLCLNHKMVGTHWPGGFAQYIYLPGVVMKQGMVQKMPEGTDFYAGTLAEPLSSVVAAQENNNVSLGDTVVIIGDGPIGCLHIEIARARGAGKIIMIGLTRLESAKQFGPDYLIDACSLDPVEEVLKITGGIGADIVITANPVAKTQAQAVEMVRKRGKVVLFGGLPKNDPVTCLDGNKIHYDEISVTGAFSYNFTTNKKALDLISKGLISTDKIINKIVGLEEITGGIAAAVKGEALKVVVDPWR